MERDIDSGGGGYRTNSVISRIRIRHAYPVFARFDLAYVTARRDKRVANKYNVGACDLARLNVLADPNFLYVNETLRIPARATFPNDYSCFSTNNTNTTADCIYGGPHVYTILPGDTIQKIANERFNITTESILSFGAQPGYIAALNPGIYDLLQTGETVKIPTCANTACTMTDFTFTYGTLQDFAAAYNVTVGQLMSLNLGYNHTDYIAPLGVLYDCSILE
ncbi:hypothetical protein BO99DRAFT_439523 [Aspergillus violaceofuscus CBS 115571]|uniref:LysM domain-containing protein n=1 Tax=Aspergillus violaceofuscus (strain CBS 115571) TaxID=1450538 RepID=A0A2V5HID9_ASPV1|nr:hypothetical protein BO99DRAFT_439523 [Aspergillus violaceofuscus CBS 115571]